MRMTVQLVSWRSTFAWLFTLIPLNFNHFSRSNISEFLKRQNSFCPHLFCVVHFPMSEVVSGVMSESEPMCVSEPLSVSEVITRSMSVFVSELPQNLVSESASDTDSDTNSCPNSSPCPFIYGLNFKIATFETNHWISHREWNKINFDFYSGEFRNYWNKSGLFRTENISFRLWNI